MAAHGVQEPRVISSDRGDSLEADAFRQMLARLRSRQRPELTSEEIDEINALVARERKAGRAEHDLTGDVQAEPAETLDDDGFCRLVERVWAHTAQDPTPQEEADALIAEERRAARRERGADAGKGLAQTGRRSRPL